MSKSKRSKIAELPDGVGITTNKTGDRKYWQVRLGKKFTGGPIIRKKFDALTAAREWIFGSEPTELRTMPGAVVTLKQRAGGAAFGLSAAQINEAAAAFRVLENSGLSLTEAVAYAVKHARPACGEKPLKAAIEDLCRVKRSAGRDEDYVRGLGWSLGRFAADFKNEAIHKVSRDEIEGWLDEEDFTLITRRNYIRDLSILFNFAVSRGWTAENPVAGITKPEVAAGEISILTPIQAKALLGAAEGVFLAGISIKLFAGLRTSELLQLDWNEVGDRQIIVLARHAKTRRRRVISIFENLRKWIGPFRKESGPVIPHTARQWHDRVGAIATLAEVAPLPKNVLRHSFCSYHLADRKDENLTAVEAGNSPAMIFNHYRALIRREEDITAFWALSPDGANAQSSA